jgi:hypothetical protein
MGFVTAIVCLVVAGAPCEGPPAAPTAPPSVSQFAISYERGGGFAAMPQALKIKPGRRATVTALDAHGRRRSVEFEVAVKKVKQLRAAAETARIGEIAPPQPSTCADCFVYTVAYRGETVSIEEVDVPARMRPLIDRAEALIAAHLPFH